MKWSSFIFWVMASAMCLMMVSPVFADTLITGLTATGHDSRIDLVWDPLSEPGLDGYNIYRSRYVGGDYTILNSSVHTIMSSR